jgi:hypothetical protein
MGSSSVLIAGDSFGQFKRSLWKSGEVPVNPSSPTSRTGAGLSALTTAQDCKTSAKIKASVRKAEAIAKED